MPCNFRYTTQLIEEHPINPRKGKRVRLIHSYREMDEAYFKEQDRLRREELELEILRAKRQAVIDEWRKSDSTRLDLGGGWVMIKPGCVSAPCGVQPLTRLNTLVNSLPRYIPPSLAN